MFLDRPPEKARLPLAKERKTLGFKTAAITRIMLADFWNQRELERNIGRDRRRDQRLGDCE